MTWLNGYGMRLVSIGVVAAIVLSSRSANADFTFGEAVNLGPNVNSSSNDDALTISADGLSIFFMSDRPDRGAWNLYTATRQTSVDQWGPAVKLGFMNSPLETGNPSISTDGLTLFLTTLRWPDGYGESDLRVSRRSSVSGPWSAPENLGPVVNTASHDREPSISADGLELYFCSNRPGGSGQWTIWVTTRKTKDDPWEEPVDVGLGDAETPNLSADGLVLFFTSLRSGGYGGWDIWMTRRKTKNHPWEEPVDLGPPVNDSGGQWCPSISHDGSTLYFTDEHKSSFTTGGWDLWQVSIEPVVDLNGDGKVDGLEVRTMADHWGENDSLCDVGPTPLGDGTVDVQDLIVLAEYIGKEVDDLTLVAHWALDETEGIVAHDSVGKNDGTVMGAAVWQPDGGTIDGALECDGATFVAADHVLSPSNGPFSVLAWVKGGAPGQTIISQQGGANWLITDAAGGLMTELKSASRQAGVLYSDSVITDGDWRRVGFTWDGSNRSLYVDDVPVAEDTQAGLADCSGGLNIGCAKNMAAGTFFTGLIDDVRIYNRAVRP